MTSSASYMMPSDFPDLQTFLPWHADVAAKWLHDRSRFAHAWLIHGAGGIGKTHFARAAAASLLCENPQQSMACRQCQACLWLRSGNHPDFRAVRPDAVALAEGAVDADEAGAAEARKAPSREIRIEQIRALESWANTATHRGGVRVINLYPANVLNAFAANSLLKLLEEPPPGTVFLLVADAPDSLLPTLVSRCRRLPLPMPEKSVALNWLQQAGVADAAERLAAAGGSPLLALRDFESGAAPCPAWLEQTARALGQGRLETASASLANQLDKQPATLWLHALQRLMADVILLQAGAQVRYYPKLAGVLQTIAQRVSPRATTDAFRWLGSQQRVANHPLNPRLFAHAALLHISTLTA